MVKICSTKYSTENEKKYKEYFDKFSFPLSDFQKYSIESIVEGHHSLICVPTGSGKTLPAEFAIMFFSNLGKKVIYTSPIKALSNQKYYDFSKQYPNISFGLITGDIKLNPDADVVIMTAEILQNLIFKSINNNNSSSSSSNNVDCTDSTNNELLKIGCVIHDEVHMINNAERGHVWENILMTLPSHIQNVMLSATLDHPEKFATWVENVYPKSEKQVYLTTLKDRVVPLEHKTFITCNQSLLKLIKDKEIEKQIRDIIDKPIIIQSSKGVFDEIHYYKMKKVLDIFSQKKLYMKRASVLNKVCKYMVDNNLLPCVCFILSRKQIEIAAREITVVLLEDDSKIPYTVSRECEQILRSKLPNFQEYLELPEYISMVALLEKGIATHHSGTLPIIKEIVELLFSKGYIKLLFATETFSCGLNMPIKTVIFTDVTKFDGRDNRLLYGYEYNQMGGRAGRRGIDTLGTVIHLNNLFKPVGLTDYKLMLQGKPQTLISKFKISYNLILNMLLTTASNNTNDNTNDNPILKFVEKSMVQIDINSEISILKKELMEKEKQIELMNINSLKTPLDIINRYIVCIYEIKQVINKKKKELTKEIQKIEDEYSMIENDVKIMTSFNDKFYEIKKIQDTIEITQEYFNININKIVMFLIDDGIVSNDFQLTNIGKISSQLREVPCLALGKMIENNRFSIYSAKQLACIFSCLYPLGKSEPETIHCHDNDLLGINEILCEISDMYKVYENFETTNNLDTGENYYVSNTYINYISDWYDCSTANECLDIINKIREEKDVFLGEFVKGIIKINNICNELEKIAESIGDISLLDKLKNIHLNTLKFVATNQSLYI